MEHEEFDILTPEDNKKFAWYVLTNNIANVLTRKVFKGETRRELMARFNPKPFTYGDVMKVAKYFNKPVIEILGEAE